MRKQPRFIDLDPGKLFFTICLLIFFAFSLNSCVSVRQPPIAIIKASPVIGNPPLLVRFEGAQSFDPDGIIVSFQWDFGDGTATGVIPPTGVTQTHSYETTGTYKAVLTVTDNHGLMDKDAVHITVVQTPSFEFSSAWSALRIRKGSEMAFSSSRNTPRGIEIYRLSGPATSCPLVSPHACTERSCQKINQYSIDKPIPILAVDSLLIFEKDLPVENLFSGNSPSFDDFPLRRDDPGDAGVGCLEEVAMIFYCSKDAKSKVLR